LLVSLSIRIALLRTISEDSESSPEIGPSGGFSRPVDETQHAAGSTVTAVGIESLGIGIGTKTTPVDVSDTGGTQALRRELVQVGLPSAAIITDKCVTGGGIRSQEFGPNLVANLESGLRYGRTKPGD
jgi:hypothetical protein